MSRTAKEILDNFAYGMSMIEFVAENMRRYQSGIPVLPLPRQRYAYYDDEYYEKILKPYLEPGCINYD